jgi:hypothetical protein
VSAAAVAAVLEADASSRYLGPLASAPPVRALLRAYWRAVRALL